MIQDIPVDNKNKTLYKYTRAKKALLSLPTENAHTKKTGLFYYHLPHNHCYYHHRHNNNNNNNTLSTAFWLDFKSIFSLTIHFLLTVLSNIF